jgi:hypothetical protein
MRILSCIFFFILLSFTSTAQAPYWQQQVNYVIDVTLNDVDHTLDAFEKIEYINNSPDTLHFIWFHLWPNAFKNDRTAYTEQDIQNGKTDFYFSDREQKGYINRLDFRVNGQPLRTEDHPQYIDIIKLILPSPLAPGEKLNIETPFHVKIPYNFSRGGHVDQSYQITQWFPKPAVYDRSGWHPMPYLDQGEFYSEFGNYDVRITLPANYVVAATGDLQDASEKEWMTSSARQDSIRNIILHYKPKKASSSKTLNFKKPSEPKIPSSKEMKTLHFLQNKVHDFAWFADKEFLVSTDTIQLNGRIIDAYVFYLPKSESPWRNGTRYIKDAIVFRSAAIGEYPFNVVSVVEAKMGFSGGMEYPTITSISPTKDELAFEETIEHEVGHNWFQGMLATNERDNPWMDEGINTYYDLRYKREKYGAPTIKGTLTDEELMLRGLDTWVNWKKDQPITTPSEKFTAINYGLVAYFKTATWLQQIENYIGKEKFDEAMKAYFEEWKFRHPGPDDFQKSMEQNTGKDLSSLFHAATVKGDSSVFDKKRKLKLVPFLSLGNYKKKVYVGLFPAIGYNHYDKFMIGLGIHNYNLPSNKFQFVFTPMYATNSKELVGLGRMSYSWFPDKKIYKVEAGVAGGRFSTLQSTDSVGNKIFGGFYKVVPFVKIIFNNRDPRNLETWWMEAKTYFIGEREFNYTYSTKDSIFYPNPTAYHNRYLNQLTIGVDNFRRLYPYDAQLQIQQGADFYRASFSGNYFFNYSKGGGLNVRLFGAKFGYIGGRTSEKEFNTSAYQPKLTAVRGDEDYTYSNYFIGRNEHEGFLSQQVMMRDGDLKLRTDLFQGLQGRSDNWVASMNLNTTLPNKLFPFKLPIKIFLDVGTYADAWQKGSTVSRFLYVSGLQLSILKGIINIYAPILYSTEFSDQLKTVPEENTFWKKISFSIDLQKINTRKYINQAQLY